MTRATLCRCGLSSRKPFCDNSHIKGGFVASGEPAARESALGIPELTGPVVVEPLTNGPLKITGALEVTSGTGRSVARVKSAFFCRCGQSANKPFCDGSHKRVGFESA
jgi:CDGSH-type Zn-finger protein